MRKFYVELTDNNLQVYVLNNDGSKKIINKNNDEIITVIRYLSTINNVVKMSDDNLEVICNDKGISLVILNYDKVLSFDTEGIQESISDATQKGIIKTKQSVTYTKPMRKKTEFVVSHLIPLVLAGGITVFSVLNTGNKNKQETKPDINDNSVRTHSSQLHDRNPHVIPYVEFTDNIPNKETNEAINTEDNKPILHDEKTITLSETTDVNNDQIIDEPLKLDIDAEKEFLKDYFNVSDTGKVDDFLNEFVITMLGYNKEYTIDELVDIFFETSQVPLEEKIEVVKNAFNLDYEQLDAIAATLIGEGVGGGLKYIDVYAATTTALNHLQYPAWVYDIVRARGEELGHSLYGHTCYKYQFNAYDSKLYYDFLGNRTLTGYKSVIDTLYNNYIYGLIMHNYTQFRGAWIDVPNGKLFETGGNKYLDERRPEDRVIPEITEKNNSI